MQDIEYLNNYINENSLKECRTNFSKTICIKGTAQTRFERIELE